MELKLNYKRTFFVGLAFLSICAFWQAYDNIIPLILKDTFGLGETVTGAIMAADNVLALFLLPLIGSLSDKVDTRFGKRTPFIVIGTLVAAVLIMLLPAADNMASLPLFIVALGLVLIALGMYRSPAVALMPDLTPKPLRSKANAVINFMGAVGGVYTLVMIKLLVKSAEGEKTSYTAVFFSVIFIMLLAIVILCITVREKKLAAETEEINRKLEAAAQKTAPAPEQEKADEKHPMDPAVKRSLIFLLASVFLWFMAYNAVTTAFSRYVTEVWGLSGSGFADCLLVATVAAIISYIPIGHLSSRFGRKKIILAGIVLMFAAFFSVIFFNSYSGLLNVGFAIVGIGWAAINVNSYPMVVEMSKSADTGKYTGLYYTFSMAAQILTPILSGFFLENVSYRTLFPYASLFSAAAFVTMLMVRHGDSRPADAAAALEDPDEEA